MTSRDRRPSKSPVASVDRIVMSPLPKHSWIIEKLTLTFFNVVELGFCHDKVFKIRAQRNYSMWVPTISQ